MLTCLAIDDEPLALQQLESYINKTPQLSLQHSYCSATVAFAALAKENIDIIFIDINMPDVNGIDFVNQLPVERRPMVVFTTAYAEYAIESYRMEGVIDYLLKPFGYDTFWASVQKAEKIKQLYINDQEFKKLEESADERWLFIKADYKIIRLEIDKILYIEGQSEYVRIVSSQTKPLMTLLSMKSLEERLPDKYFMRIHRSHIINLQKIKEVTKNRIMMENNTLLPIGDLYKDRFNQYLNKHSL